MQACKCTELQRLENSLLPPQLPYIILNPICCKLPFLSLRAGVERSGQFPYLILNAFGEDAARDQHWQGQCCISGT